MAFELPPVVKLAERVLVMIEQAVRRFPRYHRYAVGDDLRADARKVVRLAHRAWRDRARSVEWKSRLVFAVDDLKLTLQIAKEVHAYASFAQFEELARVAADLGRQVGGWAKQHPQAQSAGPRADRQRRTTLSTHAAPAGAHP